ncbi:MAG: phospholipase D family protein [Deltaproteobacteria bacterium]|nr:phospholipase D family protein [Deltaproteobacteria bacterium]
MHVEAVTAPTGRLLEAVRRTLAEADEALLCVAFAQARGVHLIGDELEAVASRGGARVVVTTTLGSTSDAALWKMREHGAAIRVLNPGGGTYHPKVYLGRRGDEIAAIVGSANLTSGLVANVETATSMRGSHRDPALADLWTWAEQTWGDPRADAWEPSSRATVEETIEPELLAQIAAQVKREPRLYTLGASPRPNVVRDALPSGLWVETDRTRAKRTGAQLVPARMLNLAWDVLRARGELSNRVLLDELRVHRSSFVCALLARLPGVELASSRPIVLRYRAGR